MGSKQRRKSKPARRQATPAKHKAAANDQDVVQRDVRQSSMKEAPTVALEPPQEQRNPATEDTNEAVITQTQEPQCESSEPEVQEQLLSVKEATQVLELLVVSMLAANVSPLAVLDSERNRELSLLEMEHLLVQQLDGDNSVELRPRQRLALQSICLKNGGIVDTSPLIELAGAATFRLEILEFQIRQAILDRSCSKSRGKIDVQRAVIKLSSSVPPDTIIISTSDFDTMLEEKLGVSTGSSLLSRVIFARIMEVPFRHSLPKSLQAPKSTFFAALEAFVADKPLSLDSVEGQLRHLVANHADLHASFKALDTDDSGAITVDEIVAFLQREAHMQYPRDVIAAFIKRFDVDGDGTLSVEEFVAFVSPKQFGIQVLTPFGIFYHSADRHEPMKEVVTKIKTRMFWMQHNDLFATSTQPVYKPPLKLKVSDHFVLAHHFGKLLLHFKETDPIASVLKNGEMIVLVREPELRASATSEEDGRLPEFEYRLKPNLKRSIPPLMSWTTEELQNDVVVGPAKSNLAVKKPPIRSRKGPRVGNGREHPAARPSERSDDDASVASTRSHTSGSTERAIPDRMTQKLEKYPRSLVLHTTNSAIYHRDAPIVRGDGRSDPPVSTLEHLAIVTDAEAASSPVETPTDYEYYEHDGDNSSADEHREEARSESESEFQDVMDGDECGPPEELEDATVGCDCDEEAPPPYDG